jgi:uncharacterized BrkB/YihY/UPF0761 family membrane protein
MTFVQLQRTLNTIWQVPPPSRGQNRAYVLNRLLALAMVLGVALLFIVAAVANTLISLVNAQVLVITHKSLLLWGRGVEQRKSA